jgi:DnaJ homolog subfamily A member 2
MYQRPFMKGKLYIHFLVEFSDSLSLEQCKALEAVLPPKPVSQYTNMELDECEEMMPYDVNIEEEMRRRQQQHQHQEAYDEDDDVPGGGQRVQCAQQYAACGKFVVSLWASIEFTRLYWSCIGLMILRLQECSITKD